MKNIRDSVKLFRFNMANVILFEIIFKTVSFAVLVPLYSAFVNMAVSLSGINYLTKETMKKFLKAPSTYAFIFIMLVFMGMYISINVSAISYSCHRANHLMKTSPVLMAFVGFKNAIRILRPRNLPVFAFILCYFPVMTNVIFNCEILGIKAPYIIDFLSWNKILTIVIAVVYAILLLYSLRYTFLLHIFNIEKVSFRKAIDRSKEVLANSRKKTILSVFNAVVLIVGIPVLINYFYSGIVLDKVLASEEAVKVVTMIYETVKMVMALCYVLIGLPLIYAFICNCYYDLVPEVEGQKSIDDCENYDAKKSTQKEIRVMALALSLAIIFNISFYMLKRYGVISVNAEILDKVTVTAHRGACKEAPENTLAAFELAIEEGADVIELDVRQTKDGEIVIMHDESLYRTCGVKKKVGKLTYDELKGYSAGAKFKGANKELYKDEKIPTLREAIELIDDRAALNIELKPAKTDKDLVESVAAIVAEYDLYDDCVVTSMNYKAVSKVKQVDEKIHTVYVMSVAVGDISNLEYADAFSIKYRYINNDIIRQAHSQGKEVYAWTVDSKGILEKMMLLDVDSIITNKPADMRRQMYENYYGDTLIERLSNLLESQF
ncbi:MAG: glycerophosphoryl diester phosphodiesterase membrane domain-containing protein [Eubacterium sp.]|nr:glycerophosphoryl diester phosphodiesterase membrane domain-containing protein [Eubacterium sp.]